MESTFRKSITRPLPAGAVLFEKSRKANAAEWYDYRPAIRMDRL
jgi:hypothetical protein